MAGSDKFLALYKDYEQLLRAAGKDPKAVEDGAEGVVADRLRLCRQFRNYLSHVQDPGFLEPSEKMMRFLSQEVDALRMAGDPVRKHLKKPEACMLQETDKIQDAIDRFSKLKCRDLVVCRKDGGYGLMSVFDVIGWRPSAKVGVMALKTVKPRFCRPADAFLDLDETKVWLCTDTGEPDGKLLGRVWLEDRS